MNGQPLPSWEFLFTCSERSLRDLELACLNRQANCLKAAKEQWGEAVRQATAAELARLLIEQRDAMLAEARRTVEVQAVLEFPERKRA